MKWVAVRDDGLILCVVKATPCNINLSLAGLPTRKKTMPPSPLRSFPIFHYFSWLMPATKLTRKIKLGVELGKNIWNLSCTLGVLDCVKFSMENGKQKCPNETRFCSHSQLQIEANPTILDGTSLRPIISKKSTPETNISQQEKNRSKIIEN